MKKLGLGCTILTALLVVFGAAGAQAAPVDCATIGTLDDLLNATDGCFAQDKIFTDFSYTGTFDPADITATSHFQQAGGVDQHGWTFAATGGITDSFTLGYTISVDPAFPLVTIFASQDQIFDGLIPFDIQATDTQTVGVLSVDGSTNANTIDQITYAGVTSVTTSTVMTIGAGETLNSYEQIWFENTGRTPEPASLLLLGTGLLGLALTVKRLRK